MLRAFVAGRSPAGTKAHAPVEIGSCASCHLSHDGNWPQVGNSRGHRIHFEEKRIACVACHAEGMHGFHPLTDELQEVPRRAHRPGAGHGEAALLRLPRLPLPRPRPPAHPPRLPALPPRPRECTRPASPSRRPCSSTAGPATSPTPPRPEEAVVALHRVPRGGRIGGAARASPEAGLHLLPRPAPLDGGARRLPALPRRAPRSTPRGRAAPPATPSARSPAGSRPSASTVRAFVGSWRPAS